MTSVADLVGLAKTQSDFVTTHKLLYDASPTITQNTIISLNFNKYDDRFLDPRSLLACFNLQGSSSDVYAMIDGTIQTVFGKIRLLSGTKEIMCIYEAGLVLQSMHDIQTEINTSYVNKYLDGDASPAERRAWFSLGSPGRQYECKVAPKGSFLDSDTLIPVGRMSNLQLEITFNSFAKSIFSTDTAASWSIKNFELHCSYIQSATISQYFNTNPLRVTVQDYNWSQNSFLSATAAMLRVPSNVKSLNKMLVLLRNATTSQAITTLEKNRVRLNGSTIQQYNVRINGAYLLEEAVNGFGNLSVEQFQEFVKAFPHVLHSFYYDSSFFSGSQNR